MDHEADPRTAALQTLVTHPELRNLFARLLLSFDSLEQTDFGDIEPVAVAAPVPAR